MPVSELLRRCEIFAELSPERLRSLAMHSGEVTVPAGRLIFAHGEAADAVYLVVEGTVTVFKDKVGRPMQLLARVGPGELLGELSLFDETERTASARAATDCRVVRIALQPLKEILAEEPQLAMHIQNTAARRRSLNSAAALELGQQSEVRIRLRAPVRLHLPDGQIVTAELSNLSVGGMALTGAPADWVVGNAVRFELRNESEIMQVEGRVAWSQEGAVGVAFLTLAPGHERMVYRMLRRLAEEK